MDEHQVRTFCRICEVGCGLTATVVDGRLERLRPDHDHPFTRGFACSKGIRAVEVHRDPDRVRRPQRRDGDRFVDTDWDSALTDIATRLSAVIDEHGPRSVGLYLGNPNAFNALASASGMYFPAALGSDRFFSAATQDCSNKYAVAELLYGSMKATPIPDLTRSDLVVWIGSNVRISKTSFFSVTDPVAALRAVRDRGGRVVFVDPLQIEPDIGETLQVQPDTDAYLLSALLHEVHRTSGFRLGRLEGRVDGLDEVAAFVSRYSPEVVAPIVGLDADAIRSLAHDIATSDRVAIHASTGLNMGRQGALAYWLVQMLLVVTGNLDEPGGNYFASGGLSMPPMPSAGFEDTAWGSLRRPVGMLPGALLADVIRDPDQPLKALVVLAGNPLLSIGGESSLREAFASLDLLVAIDLYRNATGELADYVLPGTDQFEREDLNVFVQGVQAEPFVQWTPRVVTPDGEQREEWAILGEILQRMGRFPLLPPGTADPLVLFEAMLLDASLDELRACGGVKPVADPGPGSSIDRFVTGSLDAVPAALGPTLERGHELFAALSARPADALRLITRRTRTTVNSWLQNQPPSGATEGDPNPLWLNAVDADRLGLGDGDRVLVRNTYGEIEAGVKVDPRLRAGVVAMTHGFGNAGTTGMPTAQARPGVNVNRLAPHGPGSFDPVSCMAQVTGIDVELVPVS